MVVRRLSLIKGKVIRHAASAARGLGIRWQPGIRAGERRHHRPGHGRERRRAARGHRHRDQPSLQVPSVVAVTDTQGRLPPQPAADRHLSGRLLPDRVPVGAARGDPADRRLHRQARCRVEGRLARGNDHRLRGGAGRRHHVDHRDDAVHPRDDRVDPHQPQRHRQPAGAGARRAHAEGRRREQPESGADLPGVRPGRRSLLDARGRADQQPAGVERPGELLGLHDARRGVGPDASATAPRCPAAASTWSAWSSRAATTSTAARRTTRPAPTSRATTSTTSCWRRALTGGSTLSNRYSVSSDLGGRIIRDKLWFYVAGRRQTDDQQPLSTFKPDGSTPAIAKELAWFATVEGLLPDVERQPPRGFLPVQPQVRHQQPEPVHSVGSPRRPDDAEPAPAKIEWQRVWNTQLVTSVQVRLLDLRQPLLELRAARRAAEPRPGHAVEPRTA